MPARHPPSADPARLRLAATFGADAGDSAIICPWSGLFALPTAGRPFGRRTDQKPDGGDLG